MDKHAVAHWTAQASAKLYDAINNCNLEEIGSTFEDRTLVNVPVHTTGIKAGYTALHMACVSANEDLVKSVIENYQVDINIFADDGSQPIHLACIFERKKALKYLLNAGANINAEIGYDLFAKFIKNKVWVSDFGDKMSLLSFAILYGKNEIFAKRVIKHNADVTIKSFSNKTLLMYAIEKNKFRVGIAIAEKVKDRNFVNARDNYGYPATHYIFDSRKINTRRYLRLKVSKKFYEAQLMSCLLYYGADIHATIGGNSKTLLLNMAARRSSHWILPRLLPRHYQIKNSRALYFCIHSRENQEKMLQKNEIVWEQYEWEEFEKQRSQCLKEILEDLVYRRTFGLPVPKAEKQLMDELISTEILIKELVHDYKEIFIGGTLKDATIQYGDHRKTHYDFISLCCDNKKLHLLTKNQGLVAAFRKSISEDQDYTWLEVQIRMRIKRAARKRQLLNQLRKIEQLRMVIPLSYELVLLIIEYLANRDFSNFIKAFSVY